MKISVHVSTCATSRRRTRSRPEGPAETFARSRARTPRASVANGLTIRATGVSAADVCSYHTIDEASSRTADGGESRTRGPAVPARNDVRGCVRSATSCVRLSARSGRSALRSRTSTARRPSASSRLAAGRVPRERDLHDEVLPPVPRGEDRGHARPRAAHRERRTRGPPHGLRGQNDRKPRGPGDRGAFSHYRRWVARGLEPDANPFSSLPAGQVLSAR